ncbi:MmgE/PrpD family protein [Solwaraspora sp. WMMD1047]|uniref:MmgE/PrpD family protein n=1 Tax=Solwaraspora sp. WMMD1047 TaxID=3016102 RepID=UPI0024176652|nr:MmgE/PrpD family protein [Solwaraspora sp. WMMD1047]MDG4830385.1 MmgE/PrpD family protein [Solwaraspora sp. WMMD1047]
MDSEHQLYAYAAGLRFTDLPAGTVESAAALILDHLGCALLGMPLPWTRALLTALADGGELTPPGDRPGGHAVGRPGALPPGIAALVNGTAAHGFDLDDTHLPTMSHPGAVVIPAALAAAEATGADGRDLITAVVAGYEVMGRITRATGLGFGEKGFHATGQVGPMGAAVAAARLLTNGTPGAAGSASLAGAVGLAASFGGGIKAFSVGSGNVKRLHAGRAAQAGYFAATVQRAGLAGPPAAVAGKFGFVPTFSTDPEPAYHALADGLGDRHLVDEIYLKPYAACAAVHGAVEAAAALAPVDGDRVDRVLVGTSRRALAQNSNPDPSDVIAAQYSTEYSVALALLGGATDPRRYLDVGTGADAAVRRLAAKVTLRVDDQAEQSYPDANGAHVEVTDADGGRRAARAAVSAATGPGWASAEQKFTAITTGLLTPARQSRLVGAVAALADGGRAADCLTTTTEGTSHD